MKEQTTETSAESRPVWEGLEAFARQGVQELLQRVLEEEVAVMLGRRRYARREGVDAAAGYRNGYGKPRRLSLSVGTITLRRPRLRGLAERFESRLLPLFKRRTEAVSTLLPTLYRHGLAGGDFDLALRGLLGTAPALGGLHRAAEGELAVRVRPVEDAGVGGPRARLPVGGRDPRQGGAGEGQGGHARRARRPARRPEGDRGRREWPRVDAPELLPEIAEGVTFIDGVRVTHPNMATAEKRAAA